MTAGVLRARSLDEFLDMTTDLVGGPVALMNSAEAAPASGGPIARAMQGNPEGVTQAYGIVILFAGTPRPLRRILQAEREPLWETRAA